MKSQVRKEKLTKSRNHLFENVMTLPDRGSVDKVVVLGDRKNIALFEEESGKSARASSFSFQTSLFGNASSILTCLIIKSTPFSIDNHVLWSTLNFGL